jgi:DNA-binding CsgD family transcriptional regulator
MPNRDFLFDFPSLLPPSLSYAEQQRGQLHADLVFKARVWAADEVGAAMAHQLNQPLTALLLYLHEIQEIRGFSANVAAAPDTTRDLLQKALHETQRVCEITARLGSVQRAPIPAETAPARGPDAIQWSPKRGDGNCNGEAPAVRSRFGQSLTPREREVLALIASGTSNKAGGYQLGISKRTFEGHRARIMDKLGAKNAADLGRLAIYELHEV